MRNSVGMATIMMVVVGLMAGQMYSPEPASAQTEPQTEEQGHALRSRVDRLLEQLGNLEFSLGLTGIVQGSLNNDDNNPDEGDTADATWAVDVGVGAPIGRHGHASLLIEAGQGAGLTDELGVGGSFFGANDEAGGDEARLELTEAWYEHHLWGGKVVLTLGKIDLSSYFDTNAVANDATTQFLASGLVNSPVVEFPADNGPGARLTVSPLPWLDLSLGWGEADADFANVFADRFIILEVGFKPTIAERQGAYRIYAWHNGAPHTAFTDAARVNADNWGVGVSLDQQLLGPLTAFDRWAVQNEDVSAVKSTWSAGLEARGVWWQRPDDVVAVAIGQALLSPNFKGSAEAPAAARDELFVEAYYRVVFNDNLAVSAHLQVIDNAGGDVDLDTIAVLGGRVQVNF